jgi:high-affinity iron transporter
MYNLKNMLPAFLITFREVIEATLIVATILGILVKLKQQKSIKTVWMATGAAAGVCILLLTGASLFGIEAQKLYTGKFEAVMEGSLLIISAFFITWAVFFLHKYFSKNKVKLLQKVKETVEQEEQKGLFVLVFTAVFREGIEIVLFLSTIYFSSNPQQIFAGFTGGIVAGLVISFTLFSATLKLPVFYAFRVTSVLLILFAGGMLARGLHEFAEIGVFPEIAKIHLPLLSNTSSIFTDFIRSVFGLTREMDLLQIVFYFTYITCMIWYVFIRNKSTKTVSAIISN